MNQPRKGGSKRWRFFFLMFFFFLFLLCSRYHKDLKEDICVFSGFLEILTLVFFFPRIFQDPDNLCFFFFFLFFFDRPQPNHSSKNGVGT